MSSNTLRFSPEPQSTAPSALPAAQEPPEEASLPPGRRVCTACGNRYGESSVFCPIDGQPLVSATSAEAKTGTCVGQVLGGRYSVEGLLGEGTLGEVYRARHLELGRIFAVKILKQSLANRQPSCERFLREARAAGKIDHGKVVRITDSGVTEGRPFFVMELLSGVPLQKLLAGGLMEPRRGARVARQIAEALRAAHGAGVIHRALTPSNILVDANERDSLKVLDFGLARVLGEQPLTEPGLILGQPEYMSPEYASGNGADERSDQYSFGIVFYEILTGRVPFRGNSISAVVKKHLVQDAPSLRMTFPRSDLLDELEPVVLRCLQKDPKNRFENMDGVIEALDAAVKRAKQRHSSLHDPSAPGDASETQTPALGLLAKLRRWMAPRSR